ncbi:hypothetical protein Tco_0745117, partial [Tanacetum coccineum]
MYTMSDLGCSGLEHHQGQCRLAMSSDNASSAVTYTSISSYSNGPSWGIPLVNVGEILEMDPYEEVAQQGHAPPLSPAYDVEDQPYADDASMTAESPGYIADLDSMEEDSIDYLDEPEDDDEDPEEDPSKEHEPEDDDEDPEEDPSKEHKPENDDEVGLGPRCPCCGPRSIGGVACGFPFPRYLLPDPLLRAPAPPDVCGVFGPHGTPRDGTSQTPPSAQVVARAARAALRPLIAPHTDNRVVGRVEKMQWVVKGVVCGWLGGSGLESGFLKFWRFEWEKIPETPHWWALRIFPRLENPPAGKGGKGPGSWCNRLEPSQHPSVVLGRIPAEWGVEGMCTSHWCLFLGRISGSHPWAVLSGLLMVQRSRGWGVILTQPNVPQANTPL